MSDIRTNGTEAVPGRDSIWAAFRRSRPFLLLLALVLNLVAAPLVEGPLLRLAIQAVIILAAASLAADTPAHRRVTAALALPGLTLDIVGNAMQNYTIEWISYFFILGLYVHVIRLMLQRIFRARHVTIDEIGLALCTYVLLGQLWVLFYGPLVALDPHSFSFGSELTPAGQRYALAYFSYVTLTTLGYGDIQPVSALARGLAVVEALTGVLFLAVLISRLVGSYRSQRD
jgi:voltage-gated potassium channel